MAGRLVGYELTTGPDNVVTVPRGRLAEALRRLLKRYVRVKCWCVYEDTDGGARIAQERRIFTQPGVNPCYGQW